MCENPIPLEAFPVIAIYGSLTGDSHTSKRRMFITSNNHRRTFTLLPLILIISWWQLTKLYRPKLPLPRSLRRSQLPTNVRGFVLVTLPNQEVTVRMYCQGQSRPVQWINVGNLLFCESYIHWVWPSFGAKCKNHVVYPSIISLHYELIIHDFCHGGCGLQFSYVDEVYTCFLVLYRLLDEYTWHFLCNVYIASTGTLKPLG